MPKKMLITGGAGFIGSCLVKTALRLDPSLTVVNLDKLAYSGDLSRLDELKKNKRYQFLRGDICDERVVRKAMKGCDVVVHSAAESHVDRSLFDPGIFIKTNVIGTQVLLDEALRSGVKKFVQVSTDEVYGSRPTGYFTEEDMLNPSSPYSASKAAGDLLALAYHVTHGLPVSVTRGSNTFGPYQFPEKVVPLFVSNALSGEKLPLYGDGKQIRNWIYVEDHALAILHVLRYGKTGQIYNISSKNDLTNIELTRKLLGILGKGENLIQRVADRPGHDRRYAIDSAKLRKTGWAEEHIFEEAFRHTVNWYRDNSAWWKKIKNKRPEFKAFYKKAYAGRLKA